jgi:hypothetical protein
VEELNNKSDKKMSSTKLALIEGEHFYYNEQGYWVFTEKYHLLRGYCCNSGCKHCPFGNEKE